MTNVIRFPAGGRVPAATTPREEFERLAELALDVVDRIVALLDQADGDPDAEDGGEAEPSLAAPEGHDSQIVWLRGSDRDDEMPSAEQR
ncbi:hypothetical protein [Methylobacterium sp. A54F]